MPTVSSQPAITDAGGGGVLMLANMTAEASRLTVEIGEVHFWSWSRKSLRRKGETSGNRLLVQDLLTDFDQDVVVAKAKLSGQAACRTGRPGCFSRRIRADGDGAILEIFVKGERS
jgi:phosphoribosyl-AMP cyclohydrolase